MTIVRPVAGSRRAPTRHEAAPLLGQLVRVPLIGRAGLAGPSRSSPPADESEGGQEGDQHERADEDGREPRVDDAGEQPPAEDEGEEPRAPDLRLVQGMRIDLPAADVKTGLPRSEGEPTRGLEPRTPSLPAVRTVSSDLALSVLLPGNQRKPNLGRSTPSRPISARRVDSLLTPNRADCVLSTDRGACSIGHPTAERGLWRMLRLHAPTDGVSFQGWSRNPLEKRFSAAATSIAGCRRSHP